MVNNNNKKLLLKNLQLKSQLLMKKPYHGKKSHLSHLNHLAKKVLGKPKLMLKNNLGNKALVKNHGKLLKNPGKLKLLKKEKLMKLKLLMKNLMNLRPVMKDNLGKLLKLVKNLGNLRLVMKDNLGKLNLVKNHGNLVLVTKDKLGKLVLKLMKNNRSKVEMLNGKLNIMKKPF